MKTKIIEVNNGSNFMFEVENSELPADCRKGGKLRAFNTISNTRMEKSDKSLDQIVQMMRRCVTTKNLAIKLGVTQSVVIEIPLKWLINPKDFDIIVDSLNNFCPREFKIIIN